MIATKSELADTLLQLATTRAVQMLRDGQSEEQVYWMLRHAELTAETVLTA